jgi:hypothetical protein
MVLLDWLLNKLYSISPCKTNQVFVSVTTCGWQVAGWG